MRSNAINFKTKLKLKDLFFPDNKKQKERQLNSDTKSFFYINIKINTEQYQGLLVLIILVFF